MKRIAVILCFIIAACNTGNLVVITDIPYTLREVSGIDLAESSDLIWMINDSGNKPILFAVDLEGTIKKEIVIKANNRDWEDLTTDPYGNVYIGNFGNNSNDRKNLSVLKVLKEDLDTKSEITPEIIRFSYPNQKKFPPKRGKMHFDCESFFFFQDSLYLFTKSRTSKDLGKTNLYKLPSKPGRFQAEFMDSFSTCDDYGCWVTAADITNDGNQVALLTEHSVFIFDNYTGNKFLKGNFKKLSFDHLSQKESVCFKNDSILYIADERYSGRGGNLYEFIIN